MLLQFNNTECTVEIEGNNVGDPELIQQIIARNGEDRDIVLFPNVYGTINYEADYSVVGGGLLILDGEGSINNNNAILSVSLARINGQAPYHNFISDNLKKIEVYNNSSINLKLGFSLKCIEVGDDSSLSISYDITPTEIETKNDHPDFIENPATGEIYVGKHSKIDLISETGFNIGISVDYYDNQSFKSYNIKTTEKSFNQDQLHFLVLSLNDKFDEMKPQDFRDFNISYKLVTDFIASNLVNADLYDPLKLVSDSKQKADFVFSKYNEIFFKNNAVAKSIEYDGTPAEKAKGIGSISDLLSNVASFLSSKDTGIVAESADFNLTPIFNLEAIEAELNTETPTADLTGVDAYQACSHCGF
jgi:hypothetical protein